MSRRELLTGLSARCVLLATSAGALAACSGGAGPASRPGATTPARGAGWATGAGTGGVATVGPVAVSSPAPLPPIPRTSTAGPAGHRVLNVVAHPDDDLLFLSPDLLRSVWSHAAVRTVFLTAGDAGFGTAYWTGRMTGIRAAYAQMAGVPDLWQPVDAGVPGLQAEALVGAPQVSVVFLKLPDGGPGSGYRRYGFLSLPRLWGGDIKRIKAVDGSASYTRGSLISTVQTLITAHHPDVVRTQDFHGRFGDGDHGDHHAAAYLTRAASRALTGPGGARTHRLVSYQDYATTHRPADVTGSLLTAKRAAFASYARHDVQISVKATPALGWKPVFTGWVGRQYTLSAE